MPVFTIQAPDGRQIDIEAADEATAVRGAQEWAQSNPAKDTRPKSQGLGLAKGLAKPFDNLAMGMEAGAKGLGVPTDKINNLFGLPSASEATDQRAAAIASSPNRPGMAGEITGNVISTIPVALATKNPFAQGALAGAALTDSRNPVGVGIDMAAGAALNYFGGKAVDAVSDAIAPVIDPAVRRLKDAGVSLTPGMVRGGKAMAREDKMMSRPIVGGAIAAGRQKTQATFNTAAVDEALAPLGIKVPSAVRPGHDAIDYAKGEIGRAYDVIIPKLSVQLDGQQFAQSIIPVARNLKSAEQKQLRQIVSNELGAGRLQGQALKRAQGEIRRLAGKFSRSQNANEQMLGEALSAVDDELTGAMIAQNPQFAPQLQKVNEAYRGYRIVADAAGRADDGLFNTGQLKQSVRRGDFSKSKDQTARGKAFMQDFSNDARAVIPSRTPDSGTAGRMQSINPFAYSRGALDAVGYTSDNVYQAFRLAPRGKSATRAAGAVRRLKGPASAAAVAGGSQPRD